MCNVSVWLRLAISSNIKCLFDIKVFTLLCKTLSSKQYILTIWCSHAAQNTLNPSSYNSIHHGLYSHPLPAFPAPGSQHCIFMLKLWPSKIYLYISLSFSCFKQHYFMLKSTFLTYFSLYSCIITSTIKYFLIPKKSGFTNTKIFIRDYYHFCIPGFWMTLLFFKTILCFPFFFNSKTLNHFK